MFYNTTNLQGNELRTAEQKTRSQEELIMEFFKGNPYLEASPETVQVLCPFLNDPPLTSVRRGMTNLTKAGKLIKTDNQEIGRYGAKTHLWKWKFKSESRKYRAEN